MKTPETIMNMKDFASQTNDIQGIILSGYSHLFHSCNLFLTIQDDQAARQWLSAIAGDITTADRQGSSAGPGKKPRFAVNLALTVSGLAALGLPAAAILTFPQEFQEGMTEPSRSRRLGDNGKSDPANWEFGGTAPDGTLKDATHILLILQADTEAGLAALRAQYLAQAAKHGINLVKSESGSRLPDQKEHFGFRDGIAEPAIEGSPKNPSDEELPIKVGEFILGYPNSYGNLPPTPMVSSTLDIHKTLSPLTQPAAVQTGLLDMGRNGSYLVFRKLHQDVANFRRFFHGQFADPVEAKLMMAKAVGRWPSGAPLALAPDRDDSKVSELPKSNHFGYSSDPHGYGCPLGAHVRRSNPRDSLGDNATESLTNVNRHRIIRRGISYGEPLPEGQMEDDGQACGF